MAEIKIDPKVAYMYEVLEKAMIGPTDFASLTNISRETLYRWKKGQPIADKLRLDIAYNTALRLEKGCRHGRLPLKEKLKAPQRVKVLRKIVAEMRSAK